ncbi:MAG: hypothetical protein WA210_08505 [Burkholderiaceae bacterium]
MSTPTDPDFGHLPIKLDSTSNGEFAPVPLGRAARVYGVAPDVLRGKLGPERHRVR